MSDLVVIAFNDEHKADEVLLTLRRLQHEHLMDLEDAAVVIRHQDGKIKIRQTTSLIGARTGAAGGGFWGAFLGMMFAGPLGALVGGGAGAAVMGAFAGKLSDIGIEDDFMKEVGNTLELGSSAIFTLAFKTTPDQVREAMKQYQGRVIQTSLTKDSEEALIEALA